MSLFLYNCLNVIAKRHEHAEKAYTVGDLACFFHTVVITGVKMRNSMLCSLSHVAYKSWQSLNREKQTVSTQHSVHSLIYHSPVSLVFWSRFGGAGGGPRRNVA